MATKHYLSYLQETMSRRWDCVALQDLDGVNKYTYAELAAAMKRLHVTWQELGIKEGDKIALCGRNCANWGLLFLAAESYKAVVVSILPDFTAEGIYSLVDHSEATLLYVGPNVKKKIDPKMMKGLKATIFMDDMTIVEADAATKKAFDGVEAAFVKAYPDGVKLEDMQLPTDNLDELAVINYTSGSTGNPKGVMLTHLNLSGNVEFACQRIPHKPGDAVLSMLPIAHMFGLMFEFLYQVCDGAETYFLTQAPTPTVLMKAFAQVKPFMILTVPLVIEKIVKKGVLPKISSPLTVQVELGQSALAGDGRTIDGMTLDEWAKEQRQEVEFALKQCQPDFNQPVELTIVPHSQRRMLAVTARLKCEMDAGLLRELYDQYFDDHNFVFVVNRPVTPADVENTSKCLITLDKDESTGVLTVKALMDVLLKGTAGNAVHAMNLMFGLHERAGLALKGTGC